MLSLAKSSNTNRFTWNNRLTNLLTWGTHNSIVVCVKSVFSSLRNQKPWFLLLHKIQFVLTCVLRINIFNQNCLQTLRPLTISYTLQSVAMGLLPWHWLVLLTSNLSAITSPLVIFLWWKARRTVNCSIIKHNTCMWSRRETWNLYIMMHIWFEENKEKKKWKTGKRQKQDRGNRMWNGLRCET